MQIVDLAPTGASRERAGCIACVPLSADTPDFVRCLAAVLDHTPAAIPVVVADATAGPSARARVGELVASREDRASLHWLDAMGVVDAVNACAAALAPADVAVVLPTVVVAEGWIEGLAAAARSDTLVATATPLGNDADLLSVPHRNAPMWALPQDLQLTDAAERVRRSSLRLHPVIPFALGHCTYLRRDALDLAGPLDPTRGDLEAAVREFATRCARRGLRHVAADDVLVLRGGGPEPLREQDADVDALAPGAAAVLEHAREDRWSPLGRSLAIARQALLGRRVTIDARDLGTFLTGTQLHILELVGALAATGDVRLRVAVSDRLGPQAAEMLAGMDGVEVLDVDAIDDRGIEVDDLVHRPAQVTTSAELSILPRLGERLVITQQDLIAYRNTSYFADPEAWLDYRAVTRGALGLADLVLFFSEHAERDARADDLVAAERSRVVPIGTDHRVARLAEPREPADAAMLGERPFLLCLGADFQHKNRVFALRLLDALRARHGWDGRLVLAGPEVRFGSSAEDEAAWRLAHPESAEQVVRLATVDDHEKSWLYAHAAAVVYPTVFEGFGLVPFEAADAGTPCLFAPQASLAEVLPRDTATLVPWDVDASADRAIAILREEAAARQLVDAIRARGRELTWERTATQVLAAYDEAMRLPGRELTRLAGNEVLTGTSYWRLWHQIGDTARALVGPDDALLPDEAQRALAALASRGATREPLLKALRFATRFGSRE